MKKILVGLISNFEYIKEIVLCFLFVLLLMLLLNFLQVESVRHLRVLAKGPCLPHEMRTKARVKPGEGSRAEGSQSQEASFHSDRCSNLLHSSGRNIVP